MKIDFRTVAGRRVRAYERGFIQALGANPTPLLLAQAHSAALLAAAVDGATVRLLKGERVALDDLSQLAGTARKAQLDMLGLKPADPDEPKPIDVAAVLKAKFG